MLKLLRLNTEASLHVRGGSTPVDRKCIEARFVLKLIGGGQEVGPFCPHFYNAWRAISERTNSSGDHALEYCFAEIKGPDLSGTNLNLNSCVICEGLNTTGTSFT